MGWNLRRVPRQNSRFRVIGGPSSTSTNSSDGAMQCRMAYLSRAYRLWLRPCNSILGSPDIGRSSLVHAVNVACRYPTGCSKQFIFRRHFPLCPWSSPSHFLRFPQGSTPQQPASRHSTAGRRSVCGIGRGQIHSVCSPGNSSSFPVPCKR
jgi:hypothetical protein